MKHPIGTARVTGPRSAPRHAADSENQQASATKTPEAQIWGSPRRTSGIAPTLTMAVILAAIALPARATDVTVTMRKATQDGTGETLGTITITASGEGASFQLDLHGLPPGAHGFHVHENDDCGPTMMNGIRIPAGAAGGHLDPDHTGTHAGPLGEGHLGDLPVIEAASNGTVKQTLTAPRIKDVDVLRKRALIIHLGGDNYSDTPLRDGGGGGRFACGVIE